VFGIITQLQTHLDLLSSKRLEDYFADDIDKHVYYVAGYLCHAAIKASTKRRGDLGRLLLAFLSTHFVNTAAEIETTKATLRVSLILLTTWLCMDVSPTPTALSTCL
jgi:hypothetical protein